MLLKRIQLIKYFSEVEQKKIFGIDNDRYMFWKNFCKEYKFEDIVSAIQALVNDLTGHEILFLAGFVATGGCYFGSCKSDGRRRSSAGNGAVGEPICTLSTRKSTKV